MAKSQILKECPLSLVGSVISTGSLFANPVEAVRFSEEMTL
ncbi:MAG TPA: hypothetical protein VGJ00_10050 [Rhabdochlamydiaceae bacterium]